MATLNGSPSPDWPDVRQMMVTPMFHTTATNSVAINSSNIETPTACKAALVGGHGLRAPTRWTSDSQTPTTKPMNTPTTGTTKNLTMATNPSTTSEQLGTLRVDAHGRPVGPPLRQPGGAGTLVRSITTTRRMQACCLTTATPAKGWRFRRACERVGGFVHLNDPLFI